MSCPANWSDDPCLAKAKRVMLENGGIRCFADAINLFKKFDTSGDGFISRDELSAGFQSLGASFTPAELNYLFLAFDDNRDGRISEKEFFAELTLPQMNRRRQRIVRHAYEDLQSRHGGKLTPADLRAEFDVTQHPEVRSGRVAPHLIEREMESAFGDDVCTTGDDAFTEDSFKALMAGLSSVVPSDDVFDEMITMGFHIDVAGHPTFSTTKRDWSTSTVGKDPLEYTPARPDDAYSKALQATNRTKGYDQSVTRRPQPDREPRLPNNVPREWVTTASLTWVDPYK